MIAPEIRTILEDLKAKDIYACVAGGYCRDLYFNKPYRDIDIFVQIKPDEQDIDWLVATVLGYFDEEFETDQEYEGDAAIRYSYSFDYKGLPINIIFKGFADLERLLDGFNFGINMIGEDLNGLLITNKFKDDAKSETITIYKPDDPTNLDRAKRLQEKYLFNIAYLVSFIPVPAVEQINYVPNPEVIEFSDSILKELAA